jgi:polysaccharide pyruvyl transferase WcaK-like protein
MHINKSDKECFNFFRYIKRVVGDYMKKFKLSISNLFKPKGACEQTIVCDGEKLMIIGFFNRGNVGDEAFIAPYKILFPEKVLSFASIDDVEYIPTDMAAVIVAGGDVINDYFMLKIKSLLQTYNGPCYAFSVGIPYLTGKGYADLFDHVVIRTRQDIQALNNYIGSKNVSYLPDITWLLKNHLPPVTSIPKEGGMRIGIALAQPYFSSNPHEKELIDSVAKIVYTLIQTYPQCRINLLSFNTSIYEDESDYIINDKVQKRLANYDNVVNCVQTNLHQPLEMLKFVGTHDIIIGMRYHSILFALMQNVPFVPLYTSRKIENMLKDYNLVEYGVPMPNNFESKYKPTSLDSDKVLQMVHSRLSVNIKPIEMDMQAYSLMRNVVLTKKRKQLFVKNFLNLTVDETLQRCQTMLQSYLEIDEEKYNDWNSGKLTTKALLNMTEKESVNLARLICFGITNKIGTPYIWGLNDNIQQDDFVVNEAIKWIYHDYLTNCRLDEKAHNYYPEVHVEKNVIIDLNYMSQDNYQGLHRSGWSYVISGLQHLDGRNLNKPSKIMVDTCLERSFLWGIDVTRTSKIVPYTAPWTGFIHHTFDTIYSKFNCETMLNTPEFIESLEHCKCLFTLSKDLEVKFKSALAARGITSVPVLNLVHPTEFVPLTFDISKFLANQNRKIINVGAWLRDPYSIYALPIPSNNKIGLSKCALKGKEMENYFMPSWFFEKMFRFLVQENLIEDDIGNGQVSRTEFIDKMTATLSRPDDILCRPMSNKYIEGMLKQIKENHESVTIIEKLKDNEYDVLLSENIVFLNFTSDPSASNTVIECIVRNTPLIVNRYPALEEALGKDYPGFYSSFFHAASMAVDLNHIFIIYEYMKKMDKSKFTLDYFMSDFQNKLVGVMHP